MLAYTYIEQGKFELREKPIPEIKDSRDAIVRVTLGSICSSDLHIKHGSVPRAVSGITVGHEMVGVVEKVGADVTAVKPGDRVTVNVETFCGECFFCRHGYVNNCTDPNGGWALGCRIDGGQAEKHDGDQIHQRHHHAEPLRNGILCHFVIFHGIIHPLIPQ